MRVRRRTQAERAAVSSQCTESHVSTAPSQPWATLLKIGVVVILFGLGAVVVLEKAGSPSLQPRLRHLPLDSPSASTTGQPTSASLDQKGSRLNEGDGKEAGGMTPSVFMDRAFEQLRSEPLKAAQYYDAVARSMRAWLGHAHVAELLERVGDVYTTLKRHESALRCHNESLALRAGGSSVADLAVAMVSIVTDLQNLYLYDDALKVLDRVMQLPKLSEGAYEVLERLASSIHDCRGDAASALHMFESALRRSKRGRDSVAAADYFSDVQLHVDLLGRVLDTLPPKEVAMMLQRERERERAVLIEQGPWEHIGQLPKTYISGLLSKPWHEIDTWPILANVVGQLRAAAPSLFTEYERLHGASAMEQETECIHDRGAWWHYSINGHWHELDADGCSTQSPTACALFKQIAFEGGVTLLRAGYSGLAANTHLRAHHGMTNGQLKIHLGLLIPQYANGSSCAWMRVDSERRAWREGDVLFFDDSWEHEVWNACSSDRAVFQLVFVHPDLNTRIHTLSGAKKGVPQPHSTGHGPADLNGH